MSERSRVVAAVIERRGRVLLCRRPAHKRHGGLWEFPGGKLLHGESLLDAARRELREEVGVRALSVGESVIAIDDPGSHFTIEFVRAEIEGDPTATEHDGLAWVSPEEIFAYPLAPADQAFAEGHLHEILEA